VLRRTVTGEPPSQRVLVAIRDDPAGAALRLLLRFLGAGEVAEATTTEDLLVSARADHCLVLLDWRLPGAEDRPLLLCAVRPAAPAARIVLLASRPEELAEAGAAGADAVIDQGESPDGLLQELTAALYR
jgi:CheY-like chemotaxis protein